MYVDCKCVYQQVVPAPAVVGASRVGVVVPSVGVAVGSAVGASVGAADGLLVEATTVVVVVVVIWGGVMQPEHKRAPADAVKGDVNEGANRMRCKRGQLLLTQRQRLPRKGYAAYRLGQAQNHLPSLFL